MKKFVKVPLKEYLELLTDSAELGELENWGVDNWSGYEECSSRESLKHEEEDVNHKIIIEEDESI